MRRTYPEDIKEIKTLKNIELSNLFKNKDYLGGAFKSWKLW